MTLDELPVCWCGDPGTYALPVDWFPGTYVLDVPGTVAVGDLEERWTWTRGEGARLVRLDVVTRCRSHAGAYALEVDAGALERRRPVPIDSTPWDRPLPFDPGA